MKYSFCSDYLDSKKVHKIIIDIQKQKRKAVFLIVDKDTVMKRFPFVTLENILKEIWETLGYSKECPIQIKSFEERNNRNAVMPFGGFKTVLARLPGDTHLVCVFADFFSSLSFGRRVHLRCGIAPWADFEARRRLTVYGHG